MAQSTGDNKGIEERLKAVFLPTDIEWRIQSSGLKDGRPWAKVLAYVTNRAIQDRLDEAVGPGNWQNRFESLTDGGITCGIGIRIGTEWIWKWDGADKTNIEATKGGLSGAMKRAGSQWGIGRYLYNVPVGWAVFCEGGLNRNGIKKNKDDRDPPKYFNWNPPDLPAWALPEGVVVEPARSAEPVQAELGETPGEPEKAETGKAPVNAKDRIEYIAAVLKDAKKNGLINKDEFDDWQNRAVANFGTEVALANIEAELLKMVEKRTSDGSG